MSVPQGSTVPMAPVPHWPALLVPISQQTLAWLRLTVCPAQEGSIVVVLASLIIQTTVTQATTVGQQLTSVTLQMVQLETSVLREHTVPWEVLVPHLVMTVGT